MKENIKGLRHEYGKKELSKSDANPNPFKQFESWFAEAVDMKLPDANAMTLATVSKEGKPSARILLLKDFNEKGFCFFTNYDSRKGDDLRNNSNAAMVFFWPELERQIRIEGKIEILESELSDEYFFERPIGSRIAAAVSPQSSEIKNREALSKMIEEFKEKNGDDFIRPKNWGGYRLIPEFFEFWQGRKNRLNDRIEYFSEKNEWKMRRLAP